MANDEVKWLNAYSDPLATLYTFTSCMALADLNGDGDHKLIIADLGTGQYNIKLKVYKGTSLVSENTIIDLPTAVVTFFMDHVEPRVPAIAVASGSCIFVYKNLKPYYKFTLPSMPINGAEKEIWDHIKVGKIDVKLLNDALESLKTQVTMAGLTPRSQRFLMIEENGKENFINLYKNESLKKQTVITGMTTMKKSSQQADSIDCLIVGTESCSVYVLDSEAFTVLAETTVPSPPSFLNASGLFDVDYKILVCCRNGSVYSLKRGAKAVDKPSIQLNSHAIGMAKVGKTIVIGCMDDVVRCYSLKGKKLWSLKMPSSITTVECLDYKPRNYVAALIALKNQEIRVYKDVFLVDCVKIDDVPTGLKFGCFGREEGALIITTQNGGLLVKLFKRTAKLEEKAASAGPPVAQHQKLNIPKKTKIFVDQTIREREHAKEIHHTFQRELFALRLETAKTYVKMIEQNLTPISMGSDDMLKLSVQIQGFGPMFLMSIHLQSTSVQAVKGLFIGFHYNPKLYKLEKTQITVPLLVPGIKYAFDTRITALSDKGLSDDIKIFVSKEDSVTSILTAVVTMPVAEMPLV